MSYCVAELIASLSGEPVSIYTALPAFVALARYLADPCDCDGCVRWERYVAEIGRSRTKGQSTGEPSGGSLVAAERRMTCDLHCDASSFRVGGRCGRPAVGHIHSAIRDESGLAFAAQSLWYCEGHRQEAAASGLPSTSEA